MLKRIGGYMPRMWEGTLQALLASLRRLQRTPHVKGVSSAHSCSWDGRSQHGTRRAGLRPHHHR